MPFSAYRALPLVLLLIGGAQILQRLAELFHDVFGARGGRVVRFFVVFMLGAQRVCERLALRVSDRQAESERRLEIGRAQGVGRVMPLQHGFERRPPELVRPLSTRASETSPAIVGHKVRPASPWTCCSIALRGYSGSEACNRCSPPLTI